MFSRQSVFQERGASKTHTKLNIANWIPNMNVSGREIPVNKVYISL